MGDSDSSDDDDDVIGPPLPPGYSLKGAGSTASQQIGEGEEGEGEGESSEEDDSVRTINVPFLNGHSF